MHDLRIGRANLTRRLRMQALVERFLGAEV